MTSKVLVIGERGFTGRHVMARLQETPDRWQPIGGRASGLDLTQPQSIAKCIADVRPDAVINLGAIATLDVTDRDRIFAVNGFGVLNLLEGLAAANFQGRFITASSVYVYGTGLPREPLSESRMPRPHNLYACAKLLAESLCGLYRDQCSVVVTRPFNAIGRGHRETFLVPKLVQHFRERRPEIELGNTDVARDYTDVRDLAAMYELLLEAESPPECVNLCNGVAVSIATLIERLSAITGHSIRTLVNPSFTRQNDVTYACGATDRLRALGFQWKHSLDATLEWMVTEAA